MSQDKIKVISTVPDYGVLVTDASETKMPSETRKEQAKQTLYLNRI